MVQRVLIQGGANSAMTVSLPGFEVTTAGMDQTCFDSRWSGLIPYRQGVIQVTGEGADTAFFGETLDVPPLFFGSAQTISPSTGLPLTPYANTLMLFRGNGTDQWWYALVGTNAIQFASHGWGASIIRLTYSLFKRPAG